MKINFITEASTAVASYRYRIGIPSRALAVRHEVVVGPFVEADVHVFSKHFNYAEAELAERCARAVFDICDNHFLTRHEDHYRRMVAAASTLTCPTEAMREIIQLETGRDAIVIEDPYELPQAPPSLNSVRRLMWFGHSSNIHGILAELPRLAVFETELVTGGIVGVPHTPWSIPNLLAAFSRADVVVIPVVNDGRSHTNSANRAVESIRQGKFVAANPLPAYADLGIWQGDVLEGVEWARLHPQEANAMTLKAQSLVNTRFDPDKIGGDWERVLQAA